jgi:cytochrome c-type biogenesis protein CcmH
MSTPTLPEPTADAVDGTPVEPRPPVSGVPSRLRWIASLIPIVLLLLAFAGPVEAATPRTTLEAVEAELMCVTCKTPLNQSHAPQAEEERGLILDLIAQGKTKDQVVDGMVDVYGDPILIDPPQEGLRVVRLALPIGAALFGAGLLFVLIRRWRRQTPTGDGTDGGADPDLDQSPVGLTADDRRRLDADLERYA